MEKDIELTEAHLDTLAELAIRMGLNPTDKEFVTQIHECNCLSCRSAVVMLILVGDRIEAMIIKKVRRNARTH